MFKNRLFIAVAMAFTVAAARADFSDGVIKIGVLTDMSGPYAIATGEGSVLAAKMAVEDFGAAAKGMKVEILAADHKNKPDVAKEIVKNWYEVDKVDAITDLTNSGVALAVNDMTRGTNKALLMSGPGSSDLTGKACSVNTIHWTYDTWALANGTGSVIVLTGGKTWFFLTADYPFGAALQRDTEAAVLRSGGKVLGSVKHPLNAPDMTPFLKQAQASRANIIGLANAGADASNAIIRGAELGILKGGQQFAGLLVFESDIDKIGLEKAQGLFLTAAFYWDLNPKTRAWSKRFQEREKHKQPPSMIQAGVYASVLHYLKAVEALHSDNGPAVVAKMKELPTNDPLFGYGRIRKDGRKIHRLYLFEVKSPAESRGRWDYYKLRGIVPADTAFRPEKEGGCPLVK